jgi:hypothetical protein
MASPALSLKPIDGEAEPLQSALSELFTGSDFKPSLVLLVIALVAELGYC